MRQPLFGRLSLRKRIVFLALLGILIVLGLVGVSGLLSVQESVKRALQERLVLAQTIGNYVEYYILRENSLLLQNFVQARDVDMLDNDLRPEKDALRNIYLFSIFTDGVFLADRQGNIVLTQPPTLRLTQTNLSRAPWFQQAITKGRAIITPIFSIEPLGKRVLLVVAPVRGRAGETVGLIGGAIDPTSRRLEDIIYSVTVGQTGYVDIVDNQGIILASSRPERIFQQSDHSDFLSNLIRSKTAKVGTCHSCHTSGSAEQKEREIIAFAPLTLVPWGVSIRQSEGEALGPALVLRRRFFGLSVVIVLGGLFFAWGMAQSVIRPINQLISSVQRIAGGDLSEPVPFLGQDEIGRLGQNFEAMRLKLRESLDEITHWNRVLEERVKERTRELEVSREELHKKEVVRGELIRKIISAQEEERRRIARELHDETSQALVALSVAIDTAMAAPRKDVEKIRGQMENVKSMARRMLDDIHRLIFDLRPNILDDLGLKAAVEVLLERHLDPLGIETDLDISGGERRLPPEMETAVFRIIQEGVTNIARHSGAKEVAITLEFREKTIGVTIVDDGRGFDPASISLKPDASHQGWGLLGMEERVTLLGGTLNIDSASGKGTRITVELPVSEVQAEVEAKAEAKAEADSRSGS